VTFRQALVVLALMLAAAACARSMPPPGGELPAEPPALVQATPEPFSVMPGYRGRVVLRFDRRLSERIPADVVSVSPATSDVRWRRGRHDISIWLAEGWEPGQIYRIEVAPGVRDLYGNVTREPVEFIFSTGPEIPATALAGMVTDRLTGRPPARGVVEAVRLEDAVIHRVAADSAGFFALRSLPPGTYSVQAYDDANRNRRLDPTELRSSHATVPLTSDTDTATVVFGLLPPDTMPARLVRAEPIDSVTVRLLFTSHFDPEHEPVDAQVRLFAMPDSALVPVEAEVMTAAAHARLAPARAPAADTIVDMPLPGRPAAPGGPPLPGRELVVVFDRPLRPGAEYVLEIAGVTTIQGVPDGGGAAAFRAATPPPPVVVPPDTLRLR
jgi:hypothetical protein